VPVSIREVAAAAEVSLSTVSKVLNSSANAQISPATRKRVQDAARRLGYHPNAIARGLVRKQMNTLGMVMAYDQLSVTSDPYLGPVLDGILAVNKRNHQKTVIFAEESWESALENISTYCDGHCDGLMLIIPRLDVPIIEEIRRRDVPFILVGDSREGEGLASVDCDNVAGSREIVHYLIQQGHRRIACLLGNAELPSTAERHQGYWLALTEAGIPYDASLALPGEYWETSGYENALKVLDWPEEKRPTALFCGNDRIAIGAYQALEERGARVPEAMSVVGFDDILGVQALRPGLTTMRHPIREVGERAAEMLLALIRRESPRGPRERLAPTLVIRDSVAPLREG